ncbi:hypothetical protein K435DRAFT_400590 [Dendrothele bispora CBS 962.96]|uniref:Uncharacterized protein n=1 Tax=Dendrothele bispora (strain CBS 962.96) TaxID=1314807 RepID=A0A4S8L806_DENBC|nr:hypothetical protein K435DRAFT_400590 [Dendrothele bispora CBS 962.96]
MSTSSVYCTVGSVSCSISTTISSVPTQDGNNLPPASTLTSNLVARPLLLSQFSLRITRQLKEDHNFDHTSCAGVDGYCAHAFFVENSNQRTEGLLGTC